jgi:hypothetical protein
MHHPPIGGVSFLCIFLLDTWYIVNRHSVSLARLPVLAPGDHRDRLAGLGEDLGLPADMEPATLSLLAAYCGECQKPQSLGGK